MAPPLYFFPKLTRAQLAPDGHFCRSLLAARDLDRTLADVDDPAQCSLFELPGSGPGGASGCVLTALPVSGEAPTRLQYVPDFQTWTDYGDVWVGIDNEHPPTPADLARRRQYPGYLVELAGLQWSVPVIRDPQGDTGLPQDWDLGRDGTVTETIRDAYRALWEDFLDVVDLFFSPEHPSPPGQFSMDRGKAMRRCLDVLAVNYRVGRHEQNALRLIDSETWSSVLSAAVDLTTFYAVFEQAQGAKKKRLEEAAESAASSTGPPADSPAIDPA